MKSICVSCILYTLKDMEVDDNLYIDIFGVWLSKIIQSGGLTSNDIIHVIMDTRTSEYLENNSNILSMLVPALPCSFTIATVEPPTNNLEGMMYKYCTFDYSQDVYIYCDIDILISKSLHDLVEPFNDNTIYLCVEGKLSHPHYSAGFLDVIENEELPGFSAGKFIILGKDIRNSFFNTINRVCDYSTDYYTKEQPFFNLAVCMIPMDTVSVNIGTLVKYVSFNGKDYYKNLTVFNDMAGDVGNGKVHAIKVMNALALYTAGIY